MVSASFHCWKLNIFCRPEDHRRDDGRDQYLQQRVEYWARPCTERLFDVSHSCQCAWGLQMVLGRFYAGHGACPNWSSRPRPTTTILSDSSRNRHDRSTSSNRSWPGWSQLGAIRAIGPTRQAQLPPATVSVVFLWPTSHISGRHTPLSPTSTALSRLA